MIPEPTTILWTWLRTAIDTTFPIWVDEGAAFRLRDRWGNTADRFAQAVQDASAANGTMTAAWRDAQGLVYQQQLDLMLTSPSSGTAELIQAMRDLSALSDQYGQNIVWIKDQIYAELIANGVAFALSFGLGPGLGDWIRGRIVAGAAGRILEVIATAASRMAAFGKTLTGNIVGQMVEEPLITLGGQLIDSWRGQRDSIDWRQVGLAVPAAALGTVLNVPLAPLGRLVAAPVRRITPAPVRNTVGQSTEAFVTNGITSPVSGTFVQAVADGKDPWREDYWKAIREQALGAGVLAGARVVHHDSGHALRDLVSPHPPQSDPKSVVQQDRSPAGTTGNAPPANPGDDGPGPNGPPSEVPSAPRDAGTSEATRQTRSAQSDTTVAAQDERIESRPFAEAGLGARSAPAAVQGHPTSNGQVQAQQPQVVAKPTAGQQPAVTQAPPTQAQVSAGQGTSQAGAPRGGQQGGTAEAGPAARAEKGESGGPPAGKNGSKGPTDDPPPSPPEPGQAEQPDDDHDRSAAIEDAKLAAEQPADAEPQTGAEQHVGRPAGEAAEHGARHPAEAAEHRTDADGRRADAQHDGKHDDGKHNDAGIAPAAIRVPARADSNEFEQEAVQGFVDALNERDDLNQLTPAADARRRHFYKAPDTGKRKGRVQRFPLHADDPGRRVFPAVDPDGNVVPVQVPPARIQPGGDFVTRSVVGGSVRSKESIPFTHPRLGLDARALNHLQQAVDGWMQALGKLRRVVRRLGFSPAERVLAQLTDEERAALEDIRGTGTPMPQWRPHRSKVGEWLGEMFARETYRWLRTHPEYANEEIHPVLFEVTGGPGRLDQLYVRIDPESREILGFVIVEAKSVFGKLGSRIGADLRSYLQGHPEYVRSLLAELRRDVDRPDGRGNERVAVLAAHPTEAASPRTRDAEGRRLHEVRPVRPEVATPLTTAAELADALAKSLDEGNLSYLVVQAKVAFTARRAKAWGLSITDYDLSPHGGQTVYAPERPGFVADARRPGEAAVTEEEALAAAMHARASDLGGLITGAPQRHGDVVVVQTRDHGTQRFRVEIGPVPSGRLAATNLSTDGSPHVTRLAPGIRADQLTRAWVHEIGHSIRAVASPNATQHLEHTAHDEVDNLCLEAQIDEYRYVSRQWAEANATADRTGRPEDRAVEQRLRQDLDGLVRSLGRQGRPAAQSRAAAPPSQSSDPSAWKQIDRGTVGDRSVRSYGGNVVTRPIQGMRAGQTVVAELRSVIPDAAPPMMRTIADSAALNGIPVLDDRPIGWSFFGTPGVTALGVTVDPAAFATLEALLAGQIAAGHVATLAITKLPGPSAAGVARFRYTMSRTAPDGTVSVHSAVDLATLAGTLLATSSSTAQQQPAGHQPAAVAQAGTTEIRTPPVSRILHRLTGWAIFGTPGWLIVNAAAQQAIGRSDVLAAAGIDRATPVAHVVDGHQGIYDVVTMDRIRFRLAMQVGPVHGGQWADASIAIGDRSSQVNLVLSDQMGAGNVAPVLARILAESAAEIRRGADPAAADPPKIFGAGTNPRTQAAQSIEDHGARVELVQRGNELRAARRWAFLHAMALRVEGTKLLTAMGLRGHQRSADLLRTLLTQEERDLADLLDTRKSLKDERARLRDYEAKALRGQGLTNLVISVAAVVTGDLVTGIGIFVPALANALTGGVMERWLDGRKEVGRQPAYDADREARDRRNPGLRGLLDEVAPVNSGPTAKLPRATSRWNYLIRYSVPTLSTLAVAGALTQIGVPAWSSVWVVGFSAAAKVITEKLVDWKKFDYRLNRIDRAIEARLTDPRSLDSRLLDSFTELSARTERALATLTGVATVRPALPSSPAGNSGTERDMPPFGLHVFVQAIDGISAAGRRYFLGKPQDVTDPTDLSRAIGADLEQIIGAVGPILPTGLTGAFGEMIFLNREEAVGDRQKNHDAIVREAAQGERTVADLRPWYDALEQRVRVLEAMAGLAPGFGVRAGERAGFPQSPAGPAGTRPPGQSSPLTYSIPVLSASVGGVGFLFVLDGVLGLPVSGVVLTVAGTVGALAGTPLARHRFRGAELDRKDEVADALGKQLADPRRVLEQRAIIRYLVTQLTVRAERFLARTEDAPAMVRPVVTSPADQLRVAVNEAIRELADAPGRKPKLYDRLVAMEKLLDTVDALEHHDQHGTTESVALLQEELRERLETLNELWQEQGEPNGFPLPPLTAQPGAIARALNPGKNQTP